MTTEENEKISVCIIAKNEKEFIENCLKSVLPIAHEIIVLDTGSTDNTKEIAKKYAKVYETTWEEDFSKARNECLKYATGDWILYLDADEVLTKETQEKLLPFLKENKESKKYTVFCFKILNQKPANMGVESFYRYTLFRNNLDIHFVGIIHEQLYHDTEQLIIKHCPFFSIYHVGNVITLEERRKKSEKYISILLKEMTNVKNKLDNRHSYFYIGNAYRGVENYDKAIESYLNSLELLNEKFSITKETDTYEKKIFYSNVLSVLITVLINNKKDFELALKYINELLEISPNLPEGLYYLAICNQNFGKFDIAIETYHKILKLFSNEENINPLGILSKGESLIPYIMTELGRCYLIKGEEQKGINFLMQSNSLNSNIPTTLLHLEKFYLMRENLQRSIEYYIACNKRFISPEFEKELREKSLLKVNNKEYQKLLIRLLSEILKLSILLDVEKDSIKNKINQIEKRLLSINNLINIKNKDEIQKLTQENIEYILDILNNESNKDKIYEYYCYLGDNYYLNNESDKGLESYKKACELFEKTDLPKFSDFYYKILFQIARILIFNKKDYDKALEYLNKLINVFTYSVEVILYIGVCHQNLEEYKKSIELYKKALKIFEENKENSFTFLGMFYTKNILFSMLNLELAKSYSSLNDDENSLKHFEISYDSEPNFISAFLNIVKYYLMKNNLSKALEIYLSKQSNFGNVDLNYISTLSPDSSEYKFNIINTLRSIRLIKVWTDKELKEMEDKIIQIEDEMIGKDIL